MADQPVNQNNSDEIDLGQLFQMIRNGFNKLGVLFLRLFIYLKKSALILIGLVVLGVAIGYGLKFITTEKVQLDVIVRPNLESKDYLYDMISEIESSIKVRNEAFLNNLGISKDDLDGFEISIESIKKEKEEGKEEKELKYLEVLQKFQNTDLIADVLREELLKNTELIHRISFKYKKPKGEEVARKLMDHINSNSYFTQLLLVEKDNSKERIEKNKVLIAQIDTIIQNYSKNLNNNSTTLETGKLVVQNEEKLDVTGLITLKTELIEDIEDQKIELNELTGPISVINFGNPHQVSKSFFSNSIIILPLILIVAFFVLTLLKYLNKKASEMEV
jgi:hypothetical protein